MRALSLRDKSHFLVPSPPLEHFARQGPGHRIGNGRYDRLRLALVASQTSNLAFLERAAPKLAHGAAIRRRPARTWFLHARAGCQLLDHPAD